MSVLIGKKELVLNAIEEMLNGNIDKTSAICENISKLTNHGWSGYRLVNKLSESWEFYSGDCSYPVSGEKVYNTLIINCLYWEGDQRTLRMSLLEHLKSEVLKLSNEEVEEMFV